MMPRLNKGTSLVNFVLELKDLKRSNPLPSLRRIMGRKLTMRQLNTDPRLRKKFLKELNTRLTGSHLQAEFGIKPLIQDISQMWNELASLKTTLTTLRQYMGTRQTSYYRRPLLDEDGEKFTLDWIDPLSFTAWNWPSGIRNDTTRSSGLRDPIYTSCRAQAFKRPMYTAAMRYTYALPRLSEAEGNVKAFLDTLGVRLDPSIIWNAIPFSFLIDWVVDVSGFLRTFARDNFPITTSITDFCHSLAYGYRYQVQAWFEDGNGTVADASPPYPPRDPFFKTAVQGTKCRFTVFEGTRWLYDRRLARPVPSAISPKAVTLRKAALSASLLMSRRRGWNSNAYQYRPKR
jgi:hypothetical protein